MTAKEQDKVRKLMAIALDPRGNAAESDSAGLKAIQIARKENLAVPAFGTLLNRDDLVAHWETDSTGRYRTTETHGAWFAAQEGIARGLQTVVEEVFAEFQPKRRRR